jgi:hypothetical protein
MDTAWSVRPDLVPMSSHDESFTHTKYMPGTCKTAENLFLKSHTFIKNQQRPNLPTEQGEPVYYK